MTGKWFNLFVKCAADVYTCSHMKRSAPEGTVICIYTSSRIAISQRMQTEINKSSTIAKIRV